MDAGLGTFLKLDLNQGSEGSAVGLERLRIKRRIDTQVESVLDIGHVTSQK